MTVREMLARMGSKELSEWMAYYRLEPLGELRGDVQMSILAATMANIHRDRKKRSRPFKPAEFMPEFGPGLKEQDWETQLSMVEMLNAAFGGVDNRGDNR